MDEDQQFHHRPTCMLHKYTIYIYIYIYMHVHTSYTHAHSFWYWINENSIIYMYATKIEYWASLIPGVLHLKVYIAYLITLHSAAVVIPIS